MKQSSFDATISALDAETSSFDAETTAIAWSYRRYRRGVSGDIGDCGVGITPQMCNRVTNLGDMSTFSKPAQSLNNVRQKKRRRVVGNCAGLWVGLSWVTDVTGQDFPFQVHGTSFQIHSPLLTFFLCFIVLFQLCCSHALVFGKTLVHEFPIFYSHY